MRGLAGISAQPQFGCLPEALVLDQNCKEHMSRGARVFRRGSQNSVC